MAAYLFRPISTHPSSSSDKIYTVCIREDTRITDPAKRRQAAILTCNCAGWCVSKSNKGKADSERTCRHTASEASTLAQFKAGAITKPAAETLTEMPKVTTRAGALEL
jgi:hypothetical protein